MKKYKVHPGLACCCHLRGSTVFKRQGPGWQRRINGLLTKRGRYRDTRARRGMLQYRLRAASSRQDRPLCLPNRAINQWLTHSSQLRHLPPPTLLYFFFFLKKKNGRVGCRSLKWCPLFCGLSFSGWQTGSSDIQLLDLFTELFLPPTLNPPLIQPPCWLKEESYRWLRFRGADMGGDERKERKWGGKLGGKDFFPK